MNHDNKPMEVYVAIKKIHWLSESIFTLKKKCDMK